MSHSIFTREDEKRLRELSERAEKGEQVSDSDALELAELKKQYHDFSEEGVRRLREFSPQKTQEFIQNEEEEEEEYLIDVVDSLQQKITSAGKAAYFWGSLVATVVPGYLGRKVGITTNFLHWNFITDYLILGAIPVVTQVGSSGNHLLQIREQLESRKQQLGLVVACMEDIEIKGFGIRMVNFADELSWQEHVCPNLKYIRVPMPDTTANVSIEDVKKAVEEIHQCISERKRVVYVHCKAGKGRSWMVVMCYLTTYGGLNFHEAETKIRGIRTQINPSQSQRAFAFHFSSKIQFNNK